MDFVMGFHRSQKRNDSIYVLVDIFSKISHFIPCKITNDALAIVSLFFKDIFRIHGFPLTIMLDRDVKFIGHLWRTL